MMALSVRFRRPGFPVVLGGCAVLLILGIALALLAQPVALRVLGVAAIVGAWILPVVYAVHFRTRASFRKTATGDMVRSSQKAVIASIKQERQSLATAQNRQDRTLLRVEEHLRSLTAESRARSFGTGAASIDVLFVTSNGAGLGHISRLMAIARRLPEGKTFEILTLSAAYQQVAGWGVRVHYFPSSGASGQSPGRWNQSFRAHLQHLMDASRPRLIVFDGTWVYTPLTDVCRSMGIPLVWVQRGMWRPEVDEASTQRHDAGRVADHVIVPGDFAGEEKVDTGSHVEPFYVEPVVMTSIDEVVDRHEACAALGLDPSSRYVLLSLGGGDISSPTSLAHSYHQMLKEIVPDLVPVQVLSPLAAAADPVPGLEQVRAYPVMPYARAFEFMICAAGYNSAQEAVSLKIASILVPNDETRTDDQVRRADLLAAQGLCLTAANESEARGALAQIVQPEQRAAMVRRIEQVDAPQGALEAAQYLDKLIEQEKWTSRAVTLEGTPTDGD